MFLCIFTITSPINDHIEQHFTQISFLLILYNSKKKRRDKDRVSLSRLHFDTFFVNSVFVRIFVRVLHCFLKIPEILGCSLCTIRITADKRAVHCCPLRGCGCAGGPRISHHVTGGNNSSVDTANLKGGSSSDNIKRRSVIGLVGISALKEVFEYCVCCVMHRKVSGPFNKRCRTFFSLKVKVTGIDSPNCKGICRYALIILLAYVVLGKRKNSVIHLVNALLEHLADITDTGNEHDRVCLNRKILCT